MLKNSSSLSFLKSRFRVSSQLLTIKRNESERSSGRLKIYTKTGDKGVTSTFSGQRLPKDDSIFQALGSTDLLSSTLGHVREFCNDGVVPLPQQLKKIQCVLQDIGSHIATPPSKASLTKQERTTIDPKIVEELEKWIDELDNLLPPLKNFVLPSGGKAATLLHVARSFCREAERRVVPLYREGNLDQAVYKYVNRLSDYLFVAARYAAKQEGREEEIYIKDY